MYLSYRKKKRTAPVGAGSAALARKSVEGELARIAGLEKVKSRDPVHHLIEQSRNLFDVLGRANAEQLTGDGRESLDSVKKEQNESDVETDSKHDGEFYRRFSETAFTKGKLLCAVEQGGGKTMLTSCIKRSIDQSPPVDTRQTEVRNFGATRMRVPDNRAKLAYHQYTRGALSLVVDTAQNLTRTLEVFERMVSGDVDDRLGMPDIDTAYRIFPFLSTEKERAKLESYREELRSADASDKGKQAALNFGINRLNTIISHKNRMRQDFYFELRKVLDNSRRAAELFSQPAIEEEIISELTWVPGDDGDEDDK